MKLIRAKLGVARILKIPVYKYTLHIHVQTYNVRYTCTTSRFNATEELMEAETFVIALLELLGV